MLRHTFAGTLLIAASLLNAKPVTVHIAAHDTTVKSCTARLRVGARAETMPLQDDVTVDIEAVTPLSLLSEDCWAPLLELRPDSDRVELPVWPAAHVHGSLTVPERASVPAGLSLRIQRSGDETPAARPFETTCTVHERRWQCSVPAGWPMDLRLAATGFGPTYFWNVKAASHESHDLGVVALRQGASVKGWVRLDDPSSRARINVELREAGYSAGVRPRPVAAWKAAANARGFFQFLDIPMGVYEVVASAEGAATDRSETLKIDAAREYAIATFLTLRTLASLDVNVSPPVSADGKPWTLQVSQYVTAMLTGQGVRTVAGLDGRHRFENLEPGRYRVVVFDANGSKLQEANIEIDRTPPPLLIHLDQIPVRGKVTAGDHPVRGKLEFRRGGGDVTMQSGEDGSFAGMLAREGNWQVYVYLHDEDSSFVIRTVSVRRKPDQDVAVVDLALPGGQVAGTVVDEQGKPQKDVIVSITRDHRDEAGVSTGDDGSFHLSGLEPGNATLRAETRSAQSADVPYDIVEDDPPKAQLVLRRLLRMKVWVTTADDRGVPGALVRYLVPEFDDIRPAVTDESGHVTLEIPGGASVVTALIMPAGYPIHIAAFPADDDPDDVRRITIGMQPAFLNVLTSRGLLPPSIRVPGSVALPLNMLVYPRSGTTLPRGIGNGGFALEIDPGPYTLCIPRQQTECQTLSLTAGSQRTIDARDAKTRDKIGDH